MNVLITGGTGFVGSAVIRELLRGGHSVTALTRSATPRLPAGASRLIGQLSDHTLLREAASRSDGVIHCAFDHTIRFLDIVGIILVRLTRIARCARVAPVARLDLAAIESLTEGLSASSSSTRAFLSTAPIAMLPSGRVGSELDRGSTSSFGCFRVASERATLAAANRGVRSASIRLPPCVHGAGDHGFLPNLIEIARATKVSAYPGTGENRWAAVHVDDAAVLYRRALEGLAQDKIPAGTVLHAVAEEGVALRDIAGAISRRMALGAPVRRNSRHFGRFAMFAAMNNPASSAVTRDIAGWAPTHETLLEDLGGPSYDPSVPASRPLFAQRDAAAEGRP